MYSEEYGSKFKRVVLPMIIGVIAGLSIFGLSYLVFFAKIEPKESEPTPTPVITPYEVEPTPIETEEASTPRPYVTARPTVKPQATAKPTSKPTAAPTLKPTVRPTINPSTIPSVKFNKTSYVCGKGSTIFVKAKICEDIFKDISSDNKKIVTANAVKIDTTIGQITDSFSCGSTEKCITDAHNKPSGCKTYEMTVDCLKAGTTNIKVKTGTGKTATASVKVVDKYVSVKSVKIDDYNRVIKTGDKFTISANVSPSNASNKKVYWSSSDSKVLSVDSKGVVKALKSGKAKITAKVFYDDTKSYSDSVEYRVYAKESELSDNDLITFSRNSGSCKVGKTITIGFHTFSVQGKKGEFKSIKSQNTTIATIGKNVSDEKCWGCYKYQISCKKAGTTKIEITTKKGGKATYSLTVK